MRSDIHDALLSVGEVAVFAFSLLELLCTRILPLGAFIAGHGLLHFGRLLASVAAGAAPGHRKSREGYSLLPTEEEFLQENFTVQHYDDWQGLEDHQSYEETLNDHKLKDRQLIVSNDEVDVLQGAMSATQVADVVAEGFADHPHVANSVPSDSQIIVSRPCDRPANDEVVEPAEELGDHLRMADSTPSDAKIIDVRASDCPANHADVSVDQTHVSQSGSCKGESNTGSGSSDREDRAHVSKDESSKGTGLRSRDRQSEEAAELRSSTKGEMSRDATRRRAAHMHLPLSFSQLKRNLVQSWPALSNSPKKKRSRRSQKLA